MNKNIKAILGIFAATIVISVIEFLRNEYLFKSYWVDHYKSMNLEFPGDLVNGLLWGIWSLFLAICIYILQRKLSLFETVFIAWFMGFVLMWLVIGNLGVLPLNLLYFAVPMSIIEVLIAVLTLRKFISS